MQLARYNVGMTTQTSTYTSQSARDAQASNYGGQSYWDYLEASAHEHHAYFLAHGDKDLAESMFTRSLSEALMGNEGD